MLAFHSLSWAMRSMEDEEDDALQQQQKKNKTVIIIPSFQEVLESSQSKTTSPSLFTPDPSFTQAFSFIKSSNFYSPPPKPPDSTALCLTVYLKHNVNTETIESIKSASTFGMQSLCALDRREILCLNI